MFLIPTTYFILLLNTIWAIDIKETFEEDEIVPDVVDSAPSQPLEVTYGSKKLDFGNQLDPSDVAKEPSVKFPGKSGKYYTLVMVDPDASNRETHIYRNIRHWLVINIPAEKDQKNSKKVISKYIKPAPPKGSGCHRYVFLIFEQPGQIDVKLDGNRKNFNVKSFIQQYQLIGPLFGNYFMAEKE